MQMNLFHLIFSVNLLLSGILARFVCPMLEHTTATNDASETNFENYGMPWDGQRDNSWGGIPLFAKNVTHEEDSDCRSDNRTEEKLMNVGSLDLFIPQCDTVECSDLDDAICKCDRDCIIFGDCCYSVIETMTEDGNDLAVLHQAADRIRKESRFGNFSFSCVGAVNNYNDYYMVDECRTLTNVTAAEDREPCSLDSRYDYKDIPVDHVVNGNYIATYRNTYCAMCNSIPREELVSWSAQIFCKIASASLTITPDMTLDDIDAIEGCQVKPVSSYKPRRCNYRIQKYRTCPDNTGSETIDPWTHTFCPLYIYPLVMMTIEEATDVRYRNIHCFVCYNETNRCDNFLCSDDFLRKNEVNGPDNLEVLIDLKVIFSIGSNGVAIPTKQCGLINVCENNEVYDCITKKCRKLYCPFGTKIQNMKCVQDNSYQVNATIPLDNHPLSNNTNIVVLEISFPTGGISGEMPDLIAVVETYLRHKSVIFTDAFLQIINTTSNIMVFEYNLTNITFDIVDGIFEAVNDLTVNYLIDFSVFSVTLQNFYDKAFFECLQGYGVHTESDVEIDRREDKVVFNLIESRISVPADSAKWTLVYKQIDDNVLYEVKKIYTCISDEDLIPNLNCTMIVFQLSDVILKKDFVQIVEIDVILPEGEFVVHKSKVYICSDSVTNYVPIVDIFEQRQTYRILSLVTSSLTIFGVLVVIFAHITKKRLRNGHGLNLTALSGSILVIHVLLLAQVPTMSDLMCYMYAIALHFALLTMFTWANIIGIDMARIFLSDHIVSRVNPTKRFVKNTSLSVLLPAGLVALCASLDKMNVPYRPEYAKYGICWLSNSTGVIAFVVTPVLLSLALNVCCFIITVVSIKRKMKQTRVARNNRNHTYIIAFVKMTIILGFTWIFGIAGSMWEQHWLSMLNIILNGLQGVSILICTFVNARNIRHFRETVRSSNVCTPNESKLTNMTSPSDN